MFSKLIKKMVEKSLLKRLTRYHAFLVVGW